MRRAHPVGSAILILAAVILGFVGHGFAQQNTPAIVDRPTPPVDIPTPPPGTASVASSSSTETGTNTPRLKDADLKLIREILQERNADNPGPARAEPQPARQVYTVDPLLTLDQEYLKEYHDWKVYKIKTAKATFTFHYWSSIIIFCVVLGIVMMGLYLTWVQVTLRIDAEKLRGKEKEGEAEQHQVEVTAEGLKLKSSVVGLSILTVSLAFFYLYLVYVYPISFVGE